MDGTNRPNRHYNLGASLLHSQGQLWDSARFRSIPPHRASHRPRIEHVRQGKLSGGYPEEKTMWAFVTRVFFSVEGAGVFAFRLLVDMYAKLTIGTETIVEVTKGIKKEPNGQIGWAFLQQGSFPITVDYFHPEGEPRPSNFTSPRPRRNRKNYSHP